MLFPVDFEKLLNLFAYDKYDPLFFASSFFLFFFLFVLIIYRLLANHKSLKIFSLIIFSLFFYYKNAGAYVLLLAISTIFNFYAGKFVYDAKSHSLKRFLFTFAIIINLGILGYFKYTNFFLSILNDLKLGSFNPLDIFLPIGISFYTFKALSYVIEIYFEMIEPTKSFRNFSLFMFFFPNVLMGPIDRASTFLPQIEKDYNLSKDDIGRAVFLLITGLVKKYVIADYISVNFTDRVFDFPLRFTGVENLIAIYGFALQGYCDFSGYTDMALGIGLLLGFNLTENFRRPFKAYSVADYWRRWHLSLSTWLLDYLFKPLQISLRNLRKFGTAIAIFVTFFAVGLWHGPNWTFIFFGILHSFYLIFSMYTQKYRDSFYNFLKIKNSKGLKIFQIFFTFNLIAFTAILFRAPSLQYALDMLHQVFTYFHSEVFIQYVNAYPTVFILIIFGFLTHYLPESIEIKTQKLLSNMPVVAQAAILSIIIWIVVQVRSAEMLPFIYFQF